MRPPGGPGFCTSAAGLSAFAVKMSTFEVKLFDEAGLSGEVWIAIGGRAAAALGGERSAPGVGTVSVSVRTPLPSTAGRATCVCQSRTTMQFGGERRACFAV